MATKASTNVPMTTASRGIAEPGDTDRTCSQPLLRVLTPVPAHSANRRRVSDDNRSQA